MESFLSDGAYRLSVSMVMIRICELTSHFSTDLRNQNSQVDWLKIIDMRNIAHDYRKVNFTELWKTVEDIAIFKVEVEKIMKSLE